METNFKVDVPSFALGYSAGKKKGGSGGGAELNIAYGDTAPEDTTKLWVKTDGADGVIIRAGKEWENGIKPETNSFTSLPDMPTKRAYAGCTIADGYIYIVGGYVNSNTPSKDVYRYSIENKTYEQLPVNLSNGLLRPGVCVYNGKLYIFGGMNGIVTDSTGYPQIYCYDLDTEETTIQEYRFRYIHLA